MEGKPRRSRKKSPVKAGLFIYRAIAQLVARLVRDQEVGGSNPPCPKYIHHMNAPGARRRGEGS